MLNISTKISDKDIDDLMNVLLKSTTLWAVSLQETENVSKSCWDTFLEHIPMYNLTHFFAVESTIGTKLKKKIVEQLRRNREKCALTKGIADLEKRNAQAKGLGMW
jgi:hypothetical protein